MSSESLFQLDKMFKNLLLFCCLLFFTNCLFGTVSHPYEKRNIAQDSLEAIVTQEVAKLMELPGYTAISTAIYLNGKSYQFHYGKLNNGKKPNNSTIYEIGSITKTYTGLLLSQAIYDHKIKLDDDIRSYLDGKYPNLVLSNNKPITFRHLITHMSGLPPSINCDNHTQTVNEQITCFENFKKEDFFRKLKIVRLINNSGNTYHYSGVGIQLAGYILEDVYKSSFKALFQKYIFSRSEEQNTFSELKNYENSNVSVGKSDTGVNMPLINGYYNYAGGLKSSTSSMLGYMKMYLELQDDVVKQAMVRLAGDDRYGRAFAWNTYNYGKDNKMLYHNGGTFGHSSWLALYPNQKIGLFIVTNIVTADSQSKLNELSNTIISKIAIRSN